MKYRRISLALVLCLIVIAALSPAVSAQSDDDAILVYYESSNDPAEDRVRISLTLTDHFVFVDDPYQADVIMLNGTLPDADALLTQVDSGTGVVLIMGPAITSGQVIGLFGLGAEQILDSPSSLAANAELPGITKEIDWNSAPQVQQRTSIEGIWQARLVEDFDSGSVIVGQTLLGEGAVFIFTPHLAPDANLQFQEWAYFNYFIYNLTVRAAGREPQSFGDYPASPVPHRAQLTWIVLALVGVLTVNLGIYFFVRRYSKNHPEALDELELPKPTVKAAPEGAEATAKTSKAAERQHAWAEVGFHRPLAGFLIGVVTGLFLFIPLMIYNGMILRQFILPSAQAFGIYGRVTSFFSLVWVFFDMGTGFAYVKFFSQYRLSDPRRAIKYAQVFVWWQSLTGLVQVVIITALAGLYLPQSNYAIYSWAVVINVLKQVPGFFWVMRWALLGVQRHDKAQLLDNVVYLGLPILIEPVVITLMLIWGRSHPVFGETMGGMFGLGLAAYALEFVGFLIAKRMYKRAGYNPGVLFLAHFDWDIVKEMLRFGAFGTGGSLLIGAASSIEVLLTQRLLVNYGEVWGNWSAATGFNTAFAMTWLLFGMLLPAISESFSNGRVKLSQYYASVGFKYIAMIGGYVAAMVLGVAPQFILGTYGSDFQRAALFIIPVVVLSLLDAILMAAGKIAMATDKPQIRFATMGVELAVRLTLSWLLIPTLQIWGIIIGYAVGGLANIVLAYFLVGKHCFKQRIFVWQTLAAPLLSMGVYYGFLRGVGSLFWQGDSVTSIVLMVLALFPTFPVYMFLYGLFGGWDDAMLSELKAAADLTGFVRPYAKAIYAVTAFGAKLSPLHNRFPITNRDEAMLEARSLDFVHDGQREENAANSA